MRLGKLIDRLSEYPETHKVVFGYVGDCEEELDGPFPNGLCSYRGHYDRLCIMPSNECPTVKELLNDLKSAVGAVFTGYKGGEYKMDRNSFVHVAPYGQINDFYIIGLEMDTTPGYVYILLAEVEDYKNAY